MSLIGSRKKLEVLVIRPLIEKLIEVGLIPRPANEIKISWGGAIRTRKRQPVDTDTQLHEISKDILEYASINSPASDEEIKELANSLGLPARVFLEPKFPSLSELEEREGDDNLSL